MLRTSMRLLIPFVSLTYPYFGKHVILRYLHCTVSKITTKAFFNNLNIIALLLLYHIHPNYTILTYVLYAYINIHKYIHTYRHEIDMFNVYTYTILLIIPRHSINALATTVLIHNTERNI